MPRSFRLIPKHERHAVLRLFLYCMLLAGSYTAARTAADSLFLSRIGSDNLAAIFVVSGIATSLAASLWIFLTRRLALGVVLRISGLALSATTLVCWWLMPAYHHALWLLGGIYLLAEIRGCINAINIVTAMNDILGGHSSRYAWAMTGLGVPLAGVIIGALIGMEAELVDLRMWLLVAAALDVVAVFPRVPSRSLRVPDYSKTEQAVPDRHPTPAAGPRIRGKSYARWRRFRFWIAVLIAAKVVVLTIITFEWKLAVTDYYLGNEQSLARYFGVFYAAAGVLTVVIQVFLTGRLLTRRGIGVPLLVMPTAFVVLNLLYFAGSGILFLFVLTTIAKSLEVWRRSVHDTTLGLLYTHLRREQRRGAIAFNTAVIKPLSEVGASLILLLGTGLVYKSAALLATLLWIAAVLALLVMIRRTAAWPVRSRSLNLKQLAPRLLDNH